jgi:hypothetical protein
MATRNRLGHKADALISYVQAHIADVLKNNDNSQSSYTRADFMDENVYFKAW